jgi:two-component system sensor histidine kinase GlrK
VRLYPKSFPRLILLGYALVVLPLAIAIGYAVYTFQGLARSSEVAVQRASAGARATRQLGEALTFMERVLRQYLVLRDKALLDEYRQVRIDFRQIGGDIAALPVGTEAHARLNSLFEREAQLAQWVTSVDLEIPDPAAAGGGKAAADLAQRLQEMADDAEAVLMASRAVGDAEVARMQEEAYAARDTLWLMLIAAVPLALLIAWGFRQLIGGQIRQFDTAIRTLGRGDYVQPIEVSGPDDLAYLGQRLDWLRRRLGELEEQKSRFLRHVSHDLKTPLTALREGAQLMSDGVPGVLNERQRLIVGIMTQNSLRLQQLIEELLDFQRASEASAQLDLQPVALDVLCDKAMHEHRPIAAARGVRFQRSLSPLQVEGDAAKLRVVIDNLLNNALKFSPPESVVKVILARRDGRAVLDVIDEGSGVSEKERDKIFEPFFRGTRHRKDKVEGSGLGLAITREFVLAHGGSIEVVANEGKGGHFRVSLPKLWKKKK